MRSVKRKVMTGILRLDWHVDPLICVITVDGKKKRQESGLRYGQWLLGQGSRAREWICEYMTEAHGKKSRHTEQHRGRGQFTIAHVSVHLRT